MHGPKKVQVSARYKKLNVTRKQQVLKRDAGRQLWTLFVYDKQDGVSTFLFFSFFFATRGPLFGGQHRWSM